MCIVRLWLLVACSVSFLGAQTVEPSTLTLPLCINFDPIFRNAEGKVPKTPPGVETWTPLTNTTKGMLAYRFNLYRDPLFFRLKGNQITIRTMAYYWVEVGLRTGSWQKSLGTCGLGPDGFRKVALEIQAEASLTPSWGINLQVKSLKPEALNTCQLAGYYDVTDKILAGMQEALLKGTQTMEQQVRDSALLRQKAAEVWAQLQQPLELAEGIFLVLNPERIRLAPFTSQGKTLTITSEVQARPILISGSRPQVELKPLPSLETTATPMPPGFRVSIEADLSFERATAQLRKQVAGRTFDTPKGTFHIVDVCIRSQKGLAMLDVDLRGRVNGRLTLVGKPIYDPESGTLQLRDLDYTLDSKNWITSLGAWLFQSSLRKTLSEKTNWFMDRGVHDLKHTIQQGLNRSLAPGLALSGSLQDLRMEQPQVLEDRFHVKARLLGDLKLDFTQGPR